MKNTAEINDNKSHKTHALDKASLAAIRTGILISVCLVVYFFAMKSIGLIEVFNLRLINFLFLAVGILHLLRRFSGKNHTTEYLKGLKIGILATIFAVVPFALFVLVYLSMDSAFMTFIQENAPFGKYIYPTSAAAVIMFEGLASGFIFTYIVLPYFKKE